MKQFVCALVLCLHCLPVSAEIVEYQFAGTVDTFYNGNWFTGEPPPFPSPPTTFIGKFSYNTETPYTSFGFDLSTLPATGFGTWRYNSISPAKPDQFAATVTGTHTASYLTTANLQYELRVEVSGREWLTIRSSSIGTSGFGPRPQWMAVQLINTDGMLWDGGSSLLPGSLPPISEATQGRFYLGSGNADSYLSGAITSLTQLRPVPEPRTVLLLLIGMLAVVVLRRKPNVGNAVGD